MSLTLSELLAHLRTLGVRLSVDAGKLGVNALKGALTPELKTQLQEHKAEILAFLASGGTLPEWASTETAYPSTACVHDLIDVHAERTPNAVAVEFGNVTITYRELVRRANQLARYLRARGVGIESKVGVCVTRSEEMIIALVGVWKAGGAYLPLDPAYPRERLAFMQEDAGTVALITEEPLLGLLPEPNGPVICLDRDRAAIAQESDAAPDWTPPTSRNLAHMIYTSGSTGRPKGALIEHRNLVNFMCTFQKEPGMKPSDRMLAIATLSFDIAGLELWLPLTTGACVVLQTRETAMDAQLLIRAIRESRVTVMQATPATWRLLIDSGWRDGAGLKIITGGERLPVPLRDALLDNGVELWNMYGPTETTIYCTGGPIFTKDEEITIGLPVANTNVYVLDPNTLQPLPVGVTGEIFIGGHLVARGYHNRPELTAERFVPNPFEGALHDTMYRSGDLGRFRDDGRIVISGRADHQVKIRGFRIELGEIEAAMLEYPGVSFAVVIAREDHTGFQRLLAYVVGTNDVAGLKQHLQQRLPEHMIPSAFIPLIALPTLPNGKVDRAALPEPADSIDGRQLVGARNATEETLLAIWKEVLQVDALGIHDNFFERGGHSLLATQVVSKLRQALQIELPLATLFQAPTIAEMAELITQSGWKPSWHSLVTIQAEGTKPPIFAVPGVGGNVLIFARFAKLLGPDQPFFGLQAKGLDGTETPFQSIHEAATHYVQEIRSVRPRGPYVICGACTGGVVAFEMAQQLKAAGEDVTLMIMESWHPSSYHTLRWALRVPASLRPAMFVLNKLMEYAFRLGKMSPREWGAFVKSKAKAAESVLGKGSHVAAPAAGAHVEPRLDSDYFIQRLMRATIGAVAAYEPQRYPGSLLNVIASNRKISSRAVDTRGVWDSLAMSPSYQMFVPAEDSGRMFVSPNVEVLTDVVTEYLAGRTPPRHPPANMAWSKSISLREPVA